MVTRFDAPARGDGPPAGGAAMWTLADEAAELASLVKAAGARVAGTVSQARRRPDAATLVGSGKLDEIRAAVGECGAQLVVFSSELSPRQLRNLEGEVGVPVVDRTQVVLDIFAQRAHSKEGMLQVELAQMRYLLPRLAGMGRALSRLGGGIGTRGPGETKLEADRRRLRDRIRSLEKDLDKVRRHRALLRGGRERADLPVVALVGYTNAGKSTLFNRLTGAGVAAEDALFATLDPTLRRATLGGRNLLLSDTVGFVHNLPHQLVAAFRATLEEAVQADLLLHVLDVSRDGWARRAAAVEAVVNEIGATGQPQLLVLNQVDRLPGGVAAARSEVGDGMPVSAVTGLGLEALADAVAAELERGSRVCTWVVPYAEMAVLDGLRAAGRIMDETFETDGVHVRASCDAATAARIERALAGTGLRH